MTKEKFLFELVQSDLPREYDRAGKSATERAIAGALRSEPLEMVSSKAGSSFPVGEAIALIFAFVSAVDSAIAIAESLAKPKRPLDEMTALVAAKLTEKQRRSLSDRTLKKIIEEVRRLDAS